MTYVSYFISLTKQLLLHTLKLFIYNPVTILLYDKLTLTSLTWCLEHLHSQKVCPEGLKDQREFFPLLSICLLWIPKWKVACRKPGYWAGWYTRVGRARLQNSGKCFCFPDRLLSLCEACGLLCSWDYQAFNNSDIEGLTSTLARWLLQYLYCFTPNEWILNYLKNIYNGSFMHFSKHFFFLLNS